MRYKATKGMACEPYMRSITAGMEFDNDVQKLSKELIDRAILEKRIIPVETKPKPKVKVKAKPKTSRTSDSFKNY